MPRIFLFLMSVLLLSITGVCHAETDITFFDSKIEVLKNGDLQVLEKITLKVEEGDSIAPPYRHFATRYLTRFGVEAQVELDILSVKKNEIDYPHRLKYSEGAIRLYFGSENQRLSQGTHILEIMYRLGRQISFLDTHQEIYFRAIPYSSPFLIQQGRVLLKLPAEISDETVQIYAFMGEEGVKGKDFLLDPLEKNEWLFSVTRKLAGGEGLTLVAGWPNGVIEPPVEPVKEPIFVIDYLEPLVYSAGCLGLLLFYIVSRSFHGTSRRPTRAVEHLEAPSGLTPPEIRFVRNMEFDGIAFASLLVQMAVKGRVRFVHDRRTQGTFAMEHLYLRKAPNGSKKPLNRIEELVYGILFATDDRIILGSENKELLQKASREVEKFCKEQHVNQSFKKNIDLFGYAFLFNLLIVLLTVAARGINNPSLLPLDHLVTPIMLQIAGYLLFCYLVKGRTYLKKDLIKGVEGYRRYLAATKDKWIGATVDPELYEKHIAYAVSLECEDQWSLRFQQQYPCPYTPHWYRIVGDRFEGEVPLSLIHSVPVAVGNAL